MNHEPDRFLACHREVACRLGGPWAGRVRGDTGEVHAAGVKLDEEQDMEAAQHDAVNAEEIGSDDGVSLGLNELPPRRPRTIRCRLTAGIAQDLPHRRRRRCDARVCGSRRVFGGTPSQGSPSQDATPAGAAR